MGKRRDRIEPPNQPHDEDIVASGANGAGANTAVPGKHLSSKRKLTIWAKARITLAVLIALVLGTGSVAYFRLQNNIQTADLYQPGETQTPKPPVDDKSPVNTNPLDILVVGTDTRAGADSRFGSEDVSSGEGNADVMMAVHVSGDRQRVTIVSIPRDTMAPFPGCVDAAGGDPWPPMDTQILNVALKMGGPSCLRKTLGVLTGISFAHFMIADFRAVIDLTNAVGGVEVCVDQAIDDFDSRLKLPAGNSTIQGEDALAFLRTRHAFGDASDLSRITAQQGFLSSLVRKIKREATLTNIPKIYSIADTVTKNVTLDTSLANIPALLQMASRLKDVDTEDVSFVTVPNEPYVYDENRVQLQDTSAKQLFQAIIDDKDISTSVATDPTEEASPSIQNDTKPIESASQDPSAGEASPTASPAPAVTDPLKGQTANQQTCQKSSGFQNPQ